MNKLNYSIFLGIFVSLFTISTGCSFKKNNDTKTPDKILVIEKEQTGEVVSRAEVQILFEPIASEFGKYVVNIAWPDKRKVFIDLKLAENGGLSNFDVLSDRIDGETLNYYRLTCGSGDNFKLKMSFISKVGGQFGSYEFVIDCPVDFEVNKTISSLSILPKNLSGRLFLRNGARLKLGGQKLHLNNLIGLHIDGTATIEALNSSSLDDEAQIIINAKHATGRLLLDLKGADGRDGESGDERALLFEHQQLLKQNQPKPGTAGQNGDADLFCTRLGKEGQDCSDRCTRQPTNGSSGQDGIIPGLAGQDGHNGSDTSKVQINILEQDDQNPFEVTVLLRPGSPGKGGLGGKGQAGAPGGPGGLNRGGRCQNAQAGPAGRSAADGESGKAGNPGGCGVIEVNPELMGIINLAEQNEFGVNCVRNRAQVLKATETK